VRLLGEVGGGLAFRCISVGPRPTPPVIEYLNPPHTQSLVLSLSLMAQLGWLPVAFVAHVTCHMSHVTAFLVTFDCQSSTIHLQPSSVLSPEGLVELEVGCDKCGMRVTTVELAWNLELVPSACSKC
jgi:hypothetical protein